jgi:hypothetical protein
MPCRLHLHRQGDDAGRWSDTTLNGLTRLLCTSTTFTSTKLFRIFPRYHRGRPTIPSPYLCNYHYVAFDPDEVNGAGVANIVLATLYQPMYNCMPALFSMHREILFLWCDFLSK